MNFSADARPIIASTLLAALLAGCTAIPPMEHVPNAVMVSADPPGAPSLPPPPPSPAGLILSNPATQGGLVFGTAPEGTVSLSLDGAAVPVAPDRRFVIGFGRDAKPSARLEARLASGGSIVETLTVAPRSWDIQSLPTLPKGTKPTPEFLKRRAAELAQIAAARANDTGSEGWRQRFIWPVTGRISGVFGSQRIYAGEPGAPHAGVDIARPAGTQVVAPADGVVILAAAAPFTLEGNLLMVDHGMGLNSAFLHLSRIDVHVGDHVRQGQPLGLVGMTGRATGPHLHWAMTLRGTRVDAQPLAGPMPPG